MKARGNLLRLKHFQVEDKTRQLAQIDMMIAEFQRMADDLDSQIKFEEEKAGISDPAHFAYPTFAKAAVQRRDNLLESIRDLNEKRTGAQEALDEADEELNKIQLKEARDGNSIIVEEEEPHVDHSVMIG
ncbi:MAG: flagellar export protein FliJ [Hyphomicrobiales bacterium]|nr:flagellar export protein FliJ [Hyphomicrobiales bacterium]